MIGALLLLAQGPGQDSGQTVVKPGSLPAFGSSTSKITTPIVVKPPDGKMPWKVPPGFRVSTFATGLQSPRWMTVAPNGDVFCVECYQGRIRILRDADHDGRAEQKFTFATGLKLPFGILFHAGYLYVANTDSVVRFPYQPGQTAAAGKPEIVVPNIPARGYNQHWTRNILFDPAGKRFFLTVGSETNRDVEEAPRATIQVLDEDGTGMRTYASGMRNPVGLAFRPGTNELWATCVERDYMGDDLVPDYITKVDQDDFFGWPWYYIGRRRDSRVAHPPTMKREIKIPSVLTVAHSVPLGLLFYTGDQFPADYKGDALVAMRGSTNRRIRSGYQVVRLHFENGKVVPGYCEFIGGWVPDRTKREVYGRPVGLAQWTDGSVLIADEGAHTIWRVVYGR